MNLNSFDPDRMFAALETAAEEMADTQAMADQLTELRKARLAELTLDQMRTCKSRAEAEIRAMADPQYTEYVKGMVEACRRANRAKAKYHNLRALSDARRTQEASHRALAR